jgi:AcrR family transcriptional regulator
MIDTKQKILDAAERLIGEQGFAATSLRQIIAEAGVNLAAVHYHFGSKEELLHALVERKAGPVNEKRMELLDRYTAAARGKPVPVVKVLRAFLEPMGEQAGAHPEFVRVMGRLVVEGLLPAVLEKNFGEVRTRFTAALRAATPHLSSEEFAWRMQFMIGVIAHTMTSSPQTGFAERMERLAAFLAGGFSAPGVSE